MDDNGATLSVGFEIDPGNAEAAFASIGGMIDAGTMRMVEEVGRVEAATRGMVNVGPATAAVTAFTDTTTREFQKAEKAADAMTARLKRQADTFGMTRAAAAAYRAEQAGATVAASELTEAEARLTALRRANAAQLTASGGAVEHLATGMAGLGRTTQGAQIEFLEMTHIARSLTEQIASGVSPFRALTMESGRLMTAIQYGGAGVGGFVKQFASLLGIIKTVQNAELAEAAASSGAQAASIAAVAGRAKANIAAAETEVELALASQRVAHTDAEATVAAARLAAGYEAQTVAAAQLKIAEDALAVAQGRAAEAATASAAATSVGLGATSAVLIPLAVVAATAFAAFKQFQGQVKDSGELTRYRDSLGLTHKEMLQLSDGTDKAGGKIKELTGVTVTAGDVMAGLWKAIEGSANLDAWDKIKSGAATAFGYVLEAWNIASAGITAGIYGTFNAVRVVWNAFPSVFGDLFVQGVNAAISALNGLVQRGVDALNTVIAAADKIPGVNVGQIAAPQITPMDNANAGAAAKAASAIGDGYKKAYADARKADAAFWKQVGDNSKQHLRNRMDAQAAALRADERPKKPNDHGLGTALAELDAQVRGQEALAKAYQISDAEAMKAEALQKAEEQAIRHKGETGVFYEKELALAVEQAAVAGAKHIADLAAQTGAQKQVNDAVAAGIIPASQMSQALQEVAERRQLLAALAIAEERKWVDQIKSLKAELANLGKVQADANAEAGRAQVLASTATSADQIARLQLEARLIGATNEVRAVAIAQLEAEQYLRAHPGATAAEAQAYIDTQKQVATLTSDNAAATAQFNEALRTSAELATSLGNSLSDAFGKGGRSLGDMISILGSYGAKQAEINEQVKKGQLSRDAGNKLSGDLQITSFIGITDAAKGLFKEHSKGYEAMAAAEKALTLIQLARTAIDVAGGAARMFASLGPFAFPAVAAMLGVMASLGFSGGSGTSKADFTKGNTGTGTVLGDTSAQSASIKNAIDALKSVDDISLTVSRSMLTSLKSIDSKIASFAALIARSDTSGQFASSINTSGGLSTGGQVGITGAATAVGAVLGGPIGAIAGAVLGTIVSSLFGSKKKVVGNGLYGGDQTLGDILGSGYNLQDYADIQKKKKLFGFTTSTKYSTQYGTAEPELGGQFALILKSFDDAVTAAAGPLGIATDDIATRLNGFVVSIGKIDLTGLSGDEVEKKLEAVFSALGDDIAEAGIPGLERFQKVGEGYLETLVRVASTVEQVDASFEKLGLSSKSLGIDVDMAVAGLFDSVSDYTSAADAYFTSYYSAAEQVAAKTAQLGKVFDSLGVTMPNTLAGFRQLVEAQDLTTAAGQQVYATLLQIAPAFSDLKTSLTGAKSAADILSEHEDLQSKLLQLEGDTAAIRAAELAKLDPSNRALQQQIYAIQDAQDAAKAASDLADAWKSVGSTIMDEINRIRGLSDAASGGSFASLMGQFNAATDAARGGDQDAAKSLPQLSKSLLDAAALAATSRQELDRVQAQTAASLEATYAAIGGLMGAAASTSTSAAMTDALPVSSASTSTPTDDLITEVRALRDEVAQLRADNNSGHATTAGNTGAIKRKLEDVSQASGGTAIATVVSNAA